MEIEVQNIFNNRYIYITTGYYPYYSFISQQVMMLSSKTIFTQNKLKTIGKIYLLVKLPIMKICIENNT